MGLLSAVPLLRRDPRILKIPPYLSLLCIVVGIASLLLLPLSDRSRRTYISENALLPGQVHTYFAGSDQNVFRGYKEEVEALADSDNAEVMKSLESYFEAMGLKTAKQRFEYTSAGTTFAGQNTYAILQAPRGDATEAVVLMAAWTNVKGELNRSGIALVLALARYFNRWSLWSKDIIFVITADSQAGPRAWVDAYHDTHHTPQVESLPLKSGALQGAIVIDYPFDDHRFESIHIVYDGVNGQLPNLDLVNTVVSIATGQMGIGTAIQKMWKHSDSYGDRLQTMLRGMLNQGLGYGTGPHSSFMPYHVDAVTLQPFGHGWQDEMAMGRVVESTFRSLNNLLEHFHQSFFFYLLLQPQRFVSIGTYLPSAMLLAANFTVMAIFYWIKSGWLAEKRMPDRLDQKKQAVLFSNGGSQALISQASLNTQERQLSVPITVVAGAQALGLLPLYVFNHLSLSMLVPCFIGFAAFNTIIPPMLSHLLVDHFAPSVQQYQLIKSFSLLLLGMFLSSLATLNFSQAFLVGIFAAPLTYMQQLPDSVLGRYLLHVMLVAISPTTIILAASWVWDLELAFILEEAAFGWNVGGLRTQVVLWCVWWPAWLVSGILLHGRVRHGTSE